jgi:hypothetical protein
VDLHCNNIRAVGGAEIFAAVTYNMNILEIDLSWNSLGGRKEASTDKFCEMLELNKRLLHLDISFNKFSFEE